MKAMIENSNRMKCLPRRRSLSSYFDMKKEKLLFCDRALDANNDDDKFSDVEDKEYLESRIEELSNEITVLRRHNFDLLLKNYKYKNSRNLIGVQHSSDDEDNEEIILNLFNQIEKLKNDNLDLRNQLIDMRVTYDCTSLSSRSKRAASENLVLRSVSDINTPERNQMAATLLMTPTQKRGQNKDRKEIMGWTNAFGADDLSSNNKHAFCSYCTYF